MTLPHKPTDVSKAEVKSLASFGITQQEIASYLDVDVKTLLKYYREELDKSAIRANAAVARVLYEKAIVDRDLTAIIFWLKTRGRWSAAKEEADKAASVPVLELLQAALESKNAK